MSESWREAEADVAVMLATLQYCARRGKKVPARLIQRYAALRAEVERRRSHDQYPA